MARLSLAEAAIRVAGINALRQPGRVARAKREALRPKPPATAELRYLRLMRNYTRTIERLTREILLPALGSDLVNDAFEHFDCCGACPEPGCCPCALHDRASQVRQDSNQKLDEAFADLNAQLLAVADMMAPSMAEIGRAVAKHANKEVGRMLNVDLRGGEAALEPSVARFVEENVRLVKSVSFDQLDKLRKLVTEHTARGGGVKDLRNELMDSFGLTRSRATLIARDQVLKAAAKTNELRQKQVGVRSYTWSTSQDERVRDDHAELDGQVFDWANPPIVDKRTGARAAPGIYYQCRCVAIANVAGLLGQDE